MRERVAGRPYVIENVYGARGELLPWSAMLCGTAFGLPIHRHRLFESDVLIPSSGCDGHVSARGYANERGWEYRDLRVTGKGRRAGTADRWREVLGIDWPTTQHELAEAIPPAYTEWIGLRLAAGLA